MTRITDINSILFKMQIVLLLHENDEMFYTELWERLKEIAGSKATFNKYLRELEKKNIVRVDYRRVGRGVRAYYSLSDEVKDILRQTYMYANIILSNPNAFYSYIVQYACQNTRNDSLHTHFAYLCLLACLIMRDPSKLEEELKAKITPTDSNSEHVHALYRSIERFINLLK